MMATADDAGTQRAETAGAARGGAAIGPSGDPLVELVAWAGPWDDDDPDANFKSDIALHCRTDPLTTITNLATAIDVPVGAVVRYVLARWASEGSSGLLEIGPRMARRLQEPFDAAEAAGTDEARLAAYHQVRQMVAWLNVPLDQPDVYPA
jgi:hypothetical protein